MSIEWTADQRLAWEKSWSEPHMQMGLLVIKERLWPKAIPLPAGYDALVISAAAHNASVGHGQVFEQIEKLKSEQPKAQPLPPPNTPAALGKTTQKPE